jgi:hypothetical protein
MLAAVMMAAMGFRGRGLLGLGDARRGRLGGFVVAAAFVAGMAVVVKQPGDGGCQQIAGDHQALHNGAGIEARHCQIGEEKLRERNSSAEGYV